ncbi:hypothetical protein Hypma_006946 [Hypsizygus marmoreus]|uniref:Uncharacterized protein n=1 Tax=Hypsizygus marmoreus TaxID=39966 RepID=A0A369JZ03_HYPMA|nr:hypothetical protein Hypma_006946 [Hypsizygus marmoreus]
MQGHLENYAGNVASKGEQVGGGPYNLRRNVKVTGVAEDWLKRVALNHAEASPAEASEETTNNGGGAAPPRPSPDVQIDPALLTESIASGRSWAPALSSNTVSSNPVARGNIVTQYSYPVQCPPQTYSFPPQHSHVQAAFTHGIYPHPYFSSQSQPPIIPFYHDPLDRGQWDTQSHLGPDPTHEIVAPLGGMRTASQPPSSSSMAEPPAAVHDAAAPPSSDVISVKQPLSESGGTAPPSSDDPSVNHPLSESGDGSWGCNDSDFVLDTPSQKGRRSKETDTRMHSGFRGANQHFVLLGKETGLSPRMLIWLFVQSHAPKPAKHHSL